jgi:ABC-type nitrate/sulfonate/bicarbonate transport system substrate-binding protein
MPARATCACLLAAIAAGCGSSTSSSNSGASATKASAAVPREPVRDATLVLDFTPNAVHTGIYAALARHYDRGAGVRLRVIAPTATTDSIKLLETGKVNFAILDIHDLAIARERGEDVVGIMAIVERPLAAVIAGPNVDSPNALQGKSVGITGVPSDTAVLKSTIVGSGGDPAKVKTVTIGFNAVADLLAGRVAGATAFWNDEGVTIQSKQAGRGQFHVFKVDEYGAPSYPELVVCATGANLRLDPGLAHEVVGALVRGYDFTLSAPQQAASDLEHEVTGLDPTLVAAQLAALLPAFQARAGRVGELDAATLEQWAAWEAKFGIVSRPPDVAAMFAPGYAAVAPSRSTS